MKPTIKFSHNYYKMPFLPGPTYLLEVFTTATERLGDLFIEYDTHWKSPDPLVPGGHYELPKGSILVLLLMTTGPYTQVWTTIRRWTPQKEKYYRSIIGKEVEIEIVEEKL